MSEEYKISDELKKALRISKVYQSKDGNKIFTFQLGCFDSVLRFFLIWIFSIGNILIALGELIAMSMDLLPQEIWFTPIIHLLLLLFPYFMLRDMPPSGIEVDDEKLQIAYKKIFKGHKFKSIKLNRIDYIKSYLSSFKGTIRTEIRGIMLSGKSELIFQSRISNEGEHKIISDFFSELLDKEIRP